MIGRASVNRLQRWLDRNRLLDRLFDWLYELDHRRDQRRTSYVIAEREAARRQ